MRLVVPVDWRGPAEHDGRAVVHRVMECGTGEDEAVDERHGETQRETTGEDALKPARHRAVEIEHVAIAPEQHGDDDDVLVTREPDVADRCRVEDRVHGLRVVRGAVGYPPHARQIGSRPSIALYG